MSLCQLDQVMVGLPVEARLLEQVGVRLIETEADRRRHDGLAVALEGAASSQFIGDELLIGRSLERQEGFQELPHIFRPSGMMVTPGEVEGKGGRVLKPKGAQTKEMGAADIEQLSGGGSVELSLVEGVQRRLKERESDALAELVLFKGPMDARVACPATHGSDSVSFCSRPDTSK
jgi:hypothetical protein